VKSALKQSEETMKKLNVYDFFVIVQNKFWCKIKWN
jgi:hypothetical protein